jgi:hypothetical protein
VVMIQACLTVTSETFEFPPNRIRMAGPTILEKSLHRQRILRYRYW